MKTVQWNVLNSRPSVVIGTLFVAGLSAIPIPAQAATEPDGTTLVQEFRCNACHSTTRYLIGPPFSAIAARYAEHKGIMADVLAEKIILGGAGNWGVVPMVPHADLSWNEARVIAQWILELDTKQSSSRP